MITRRRFVYIGLALLLSLLVAIVLHGQPRNNQDWNYNVSILSDAITIICSDFLLPSEKGEPLSEPKAPNWPGGVSDEGEFHKTLRAMVENKITLQPEVGSNDDTLATISGCTHDGSLLLLSTEDVGDTITITDTGNIDTVGGVNVVLDDPEDVVRLVLRDSTWVFVGGIGSSAGSATKIFEAADSEAAAVIIRDTAQTSGWKFWVDAVLGPIIKCFIPGGACNHIFDIATGKVFQILGNGVLFEQITAAGVHTYHDAGRPTSSLQWIAGAMNGDGTDCNSAPNDETFNGFPTQATRCAMTSSETDGFLYGAAIELPGNFDKTNDLLFNISAYLITDAGAGTIHGQISIDCVGNGEEIGTFGTEVELDIATVAGDIVNDKVEGTAVAVVDTDTTGADCDPGDWIAFQYRICDTDATPISGCTSSAGFEDNVSFALVRAEYTKNSRSE